MMTEKDTDTFLIVMHLIQFFFICVTQCNKLCIFIFEYSFDNRGKPFLRGDMFGFNFFYNDTNEYVDMSNYRRTLVKLPSRLNPMGSEFLAQSAGSDDAIRVSDDPASGVFSFSDASVPEKTGDILRDILSGAAKTVVTYDKLASAHTIIAANNIRKQLRRYGVRAEMGETCGADAVIYVGGDREIKYNEYTLLFGGNIKIIFEMLRTYLKYI